MPKIYVSVDFCVRSLSFELGLIGGELVLHDTIAKFNVRSNMTYTELNLLHDVQLKATKK